MLQRQREQAVLAERAVADAAITASMLYSLATCPKQVALDLFGDQERRDPISPFVQLLSRRSIALRLWSPSYDPSRAGVLCKQPVATDKESAVSLSVGIADG